MMNRKNFFICNELEYKWNYLECLKVKNRMEVCESHLAHESPTSLKPPQENPMGQNPR